MHDRRSAFRWGRLLALGSALAVLTSGLDAAAYQEAPALAEMVKAGKLPPVDQRLPKDVEVVTPLDSVGKYGGTLRQVLVGTAGDHNTIQRMVAPQGLVRWDPEYRKVVPNLAKSWEVSPDATGIHLPPPRGPALVGRRAVHDRRHHVLCRRHPAQSRLL